MLSIPTDRDVLSDHDHLPDSRRPNRQRQCEGTEGKANTLVELYVTATKTREGFLNRHFQRLSRIFNRKKKAKQQNANVSTGHVRAIRSIRRRPLTQKEQKAKSSAMHSIKTP